MKITKKDYEIIINLMDLIIGVSMAAMLYAMIFRGLFSWTAIILMAVLMASKVFLSQESLMIDDEES